MTWLWIAVGVVVGIVVGVTIVHWAILRAYWK